MLGLKRSVTTAALRRAVLLLSVGLATGMPLVAQIPTPVKPKPSVPPVRPLPLGPAADLVIDAVQITDSPIPSPVTTAHVTIVNKGQVDAVFPAGSVLVRGDGGGAGIISFKPMVTPVEYSIPAGGSKSMDLVVAEQCNAKPGAVIFKADPDGKVRESDEANNARVVQSAGAFGGGDLQATGVGLISNGPSYGEEKAPAIDGRYPAKLSVMVRNAGSAPVVICSGVTIFREIQSPLSAKYGLRELKAANSVLMPPASVMGFQLAGAYQPGDLPGGSYTWTVLVNPDNKANETTSSNNTATGQVGIK